MGSLTTSDLGCGCEWALAFYAGFLYSIHLRGVFDRLSLEVGYDPKISETLRGYKYQHLSYPKFAVPREPNTP